MTNAASHRDPLRYRLYYRLIDFASIVYLLFFAFAFYAAFTGLDTEDIAREVEIPLRVLMGCTTLILGTLLVLARFMRDEYAELLWQRTVSVLVKVLVIIPVIIFVAGWLTWHLMGPDNLPAAYALQFEEVAVFDIASTLHGIFILLFVAIFQFLRWRDSR